MQFRKYVFGFEHVVKMIVVVVMFSIVVVQKIVKDVQYIGVIFQMIIERCGVLEEEPAHAVAVKQNRQQRVEPTRSLEVRKGEYVVTIISCS